MKNKLEIKNIMNIVFSVIIILTLTFGALVIIKAFTESGDIEDDIFGNGPDYFFILYALIYISNILNNEILIWRCSVSLVKNESCKGINITVLALCALSILLLVFAACFPVINGTLKYSEMMVFSSWLISGVCIVLKFINI